ncbi:MltA-interacting protein precursor [Methyloligella halotolerans]|uniref:MltA-interacting protein n=1 Tax=Methyloligella halotolerans TaxID=1177755 RepID=A0A1E2RXB6_9HYPH|nr:MipA/OmpV family protein [Methyloligella halotolerans]ODA66699.1 MltA-interacting protein precursor [Methyloligella halotolerans]
MGLLTNLFPPRFEGAGRALPASAVAAGLLCAPAALADGVSEHKKTVALGGAGIVKPKYEGSNEHEWLGIPIIIPKLSAEDDAKPSLFKQVRQRIEFHSLDDIRIRAIGGDLFEAGLVTGYMTERKQNDGNLLRGWGDIDGGLVLGGYAGVNIGEFEFDAAILDRVTGDGGGPEFRFGVETEREVTERITLVTRLGTTIASSDYMQTYFGVTPAQAARSKAGLQSYDPDAGFKDIYLELGAEYDLSERWLMKGGVRYGRLVGDAADSPVVETPDQLSGILGVAYRFDLPN